MEHSHPPILTCPARRLLLLFALLGLLLAAPAAAAAATDDAPRFLIEKITVTGNRRPAAARIVVSESLLKEGRTYGEDELRTAIHRIKRLPFVIEADFALQKGSERGRYELVVKVEETRPIFADLEIRGDLAERPIDSSNLRSSRHFDYSDNSALGARAFVGSEGVVFASLGSSNGLFQVGYTRYNLFGPGSFASLALAYNPNNKDFTPTLAAGVPLTVNQSLRATVSWSRTTFRGNGARGDSTQQSGQLDWLYNTTDDPLFPTQGDTVETALLYQRFSSLFKSTVVNVPSSRLDERTWDFSLSGHHYRPLTARQSLAFGFSADAFHFSEDDPFPGNFIIGSGNGYQASVSVTHALDLWQGERARHRGDLRLETSAAYAGSYSDAGLSVLFNQTTLYQLTLGENLVFRSPWAIVRLGVLYHGKVMR